MLPFGSGQIDETMADELEKFLRIMMPSRHLAETPP
jgi:hypothetical protein